MLALVAETPAKQCRQFGASGAHVTLRVTGEEFHDAGGERRNTGNDYRARGSLHLCRSPALRQNIR